MDDGGIAECGNSQNCVVACPKGIPLNNFNCCDEPCNICSNVQKLLRKRPYGRLISLNKSCPCISAGQDFLVVNQNKYFNFHGNVWYYEDVNSYSLKYREVGDNYESKLHKELSTWASEFDFQFRYRLGFRKQICLDI